MKAVDSLIEWLCTNLTLVLVTAIRTLATKSATTSNILAWITYA
ncbi:hypothetical protein [Halocatena marina]|uniref:Uncharacterized protein n=1 Tax=Halocatena marina TaxID=2934937 RepID=A0ABD5YZ01_9EURY|nr:hypothetical protein [Halocatena marina]